MPVIVQLDKCNGCETCLSSCPYDAIEIRDGKAYINEYCNSCMACLSTCPEGAISETEDTGIKPAAVQALPVTDFKDVWVFAEQRNGLVASVSFELLGAGRKLADDLDNDLCAVFFGLHEEAAQELIRWGADRVYLCTDPALEQFNDEAYTEALSHLAREHRPSIILTGATAVGRSFFPRVAARLRTGLTADCTQLEIDGETRNLVQIRPAFGGNIMAAIICADYRPQMATVRPRVMKRGEYDPERKGDVLRVTIDNLCSRTKVLDMVKEESQAGVNLLDTDVIVAGGRGAGGEKGFQMLEELAELLDGAVGASRAVVDEGLISYRHQIGQTGKTVSPKVYIACGISGAVQHLVGMQSSDIIVAINKNPDAPIFNIATYGIVGDIDEILPLLIQRIKEEKGS